MELKRGMTEKTYETPSGIIHYWVNELKEKTAIQLVFLPGLTVDHRLFDKQVEAFEDTYSIFVWDAPSHASSYPFEYDYDLADKARWLDEILSKEGYDRPVLIGQSMGGYLSQMYAELYPTKIFGFISVDSAPLKKEYYSGFELWLLKRMEPIYRIYPWKRLMKDGTNGVASTEYGRKLCSEMWSNYDDDHNHYTKLAGFGYLILAKAVEEQHSYDIPCPALLICGTKDHAGSCIRYNKEWHKKTGIPIKWIEGAGHNSNTDCPEEINKIIEEFCSVALL